MIQLGHHVDVHTAFVIQLILQCEESAECGSLSSPIFVNDDCGTLVFLVLLLPPIDQLGQLERGGEGRAVLGPHCGGDHLCCALVVILRRLQQETAVDLAQVVGLINEGHCEVAVFHRHVLQRPELRTILVSCGGEQHDCHAVFVPDHSPEVLDCRLHRMLGHDEFLIPVVTLEV